MRAEPIPVLEILWQSSQAPRSVLRCLQRCARLLHEASPSDTLGTTRAVAAIEKLIQKIKRINWSLYLSVQDDDETPAGKDAARDAAKGARINELVPLLNQLLDETLHIHHMVSDGFLSHQAQISQSVQPLLNI